MQKPTSNPSGLRMQSGHGKAEVPTVFCLFRRLHQRSAMLAGILISLTVLGCGAITLRTGIEAMEPWKARLEQTM